MVVITMENAAPKIRGECTKYLIEIKAGVFVGTINSTVRTILWEKIKNSNELGGAVLVYSTNNEQGFSIEMHGNPRRKVVDIDGLFLIENQQ